MDKKIIFFPTPMWEGKESSLDLWFQLVGELGIVEFQLATNWYTMGVVDARLDDMKKDVILNKNDFLLKHFWMGPQPLDVCYFSPIRMSEDDSYWKDGSSQHAPNIIPCYYGYRYKDEGDGIWTTDFVYQKLLKEGNDGVWEYLEKYYVDVFGELR